ncbi:MAG: ornithine cyclodeaminase family protein [Candidatus Andeanibacterium colombiense]|uniref:Ornithine cyclodeaminase family protein n=1 Tax=Candidatus Andeanibacterium colombiense TaxID=3121345 RepID=A0AAJ5X5P7_9SPHN|nr:MAG: ornithine cyclodeaminase family protein [Sphingomonadaceae bacterium]
MTIRILRRDEIRALLPMDRCIELVGQAMVAVSQGKAVLPLRSAMAMPREIGMLGMMAGYLGEPESFGIKLVSLFPRNAGTGHSSHLGALLLFETQHGYPVGLLDAAEITAIRTAAASAFATGLLAPAGASRLAILGTGEQAGRHIEAMRAVRPIAEVRIWGRTVKEAERLAEETRVSGIPATAFGDVATAVAGAQIVCTTTHAPDPILFGDMVAPGTHLNIVGSSVASTAEIDSSLVARSHFIVDYRESALNQAGEYLRALNEGAIGPDHIAGEIGQVAVGDAPGRTSADQVTLYKSLGVAAQDLVAADFVLKQAAQRGIGQAVEFP